MGKLSNKIKKVSLLICAILNATLPILLVSSIPIPIGVVVGGNILCSICMLAFTRSNDIEAIVTDNISVTDSSREPSSSIDLSNLPTNN